VVRLKEVCLKVKPNYVLHLAGITHVQHQNQFEIYRINIFGTLNLLQVMYDINPSLEKILITSSANVYGATQCSFINEKVAPCPVNHYANSKLAMEFMVKTWFEKIPIIITRPFNYTGIDQSTNFVIPKIVEHFNLRKKEIFLGNINIVRDFSDVRFVVKSYHLLMKSNACSDIYNICSGQGYSLVQVINFLEGIAGYKITVVPDNNLMRTNEIPKLIGDNHKLLDVIGNSKQILLYDTLRSMYYNKW
jgi:nucleoside-diphosphate-sugar epimerase